MRTFFTAWLVLYLAIIGGMTATYVACPGCINRDRVNRQCDWTGDSEFLVDADNPAHWKHLIEDAQLAEELAVRYADAENLRLNGVEHHGGLIDNGGVVRGCMSRMFAAIADNHTVTAAEIDIARAQRNPVFDTAVVLLFVPLYWFVATAAHRALHSRFRDDRRSVRLAAALLAAVGLSVLATQFKMLWGGIWTGIRLGNGHVGAFRLASRNHPWQRNGALLFVCGLILFWLVGVVYRRIPSHVPVVAAVLTCTLLVAGFAHTFVRTPLGYTLAFLVLMVMATAIRTVNRFGIDPDAAAPQSHFTKWL